MFLLMHLVQISLLSVHCLYAMGKSTTMNDIFVYELTALYAMGIASLIDIFVCIWMKFMAV